MKTAGVLTFHDSNNFGSVLQAYALSRCLNENGIKCEVIDFRKKEVEQLYRILKYPRNKSILAADIYNLLHYSTLRKRKAAFETFRKEHLPLSSSQYRECEELSALKYDAYIVGSDQVWNMDILDFDRAYLLDFVKEGRKIAYAASFGPKKKEQAKIEKIAQVLDQFDLITVREETAATQIEQSGRSKPEVVLDPVFLLSQQQWSELCSPDYINSKYMLCYFAGGVSKEFERFTREIAKKNHLKRVILMPEWKNLFRSGIRAYCAGPNDFLGLIRNAEMICTNSFHGTAFSIIFNKNFVVHSNSDARINTLLDNTNMNDHMFISGKMSTASDFNAANKYISVRANECKQILLGVMNGYEDSGEHNCSSIQ